MGTDIRHDLFHSKDALPSCRLQNTRKGIGSGSAAQVLSSLEQRTVKEFNTKNLLSTPYVDYQKNVLSVGGYFFFHSCGVLLKSIDTIGSFPENAPGMPILFVMTVHYI